MKPAAATALVIQQIKMLVHDVLAIPIQNSADVPAEFCFASLDRTLVLDHGHRFVMESDLQRVLRK